MAGRGEGWPRSSKAVTSSGKALGTQSGVGMDQQKEQDKEETKEKEEESGKKDEKDEKEKGKEVKDDTKDVKVEGGVGDSSPPPSQPAKEGDKTKEDDLCSCPQGITLPYLLFPFLPSSYFRSEEEQGEEGKGRALYPNLFPDSPGLP